MRSTTSPRAKGGEQGDAMMPLLYYLVQHRAMQAVGTFARRRASVCVFRPRLLCVPLPQSWTIDAVLQEALNVHAGTQINAGKTQIWNRSSARPEGCNVSERVARASNPRTIVWRRSQLPSEMQRLKILGTPLGHSDFIARHLQGVLDEQRVFLSRIPLVSEIQSAWFVLLHCANARANCQIRSVTRGSGGVRSAHDTGSGNASVSEVGSSGRRERDRQFAFGPGGTRSAERFAFARTCLLGQLGRWFGDDPPTALPIWWSRSWKAGHPMSARSGDSSVVHHWSHGFRTSLMDSLARGARPAQHQPEDFEPGATRGGWQHEAACRIEQRGQDHLLMRLPDSGEQHVFHLLLLLRRLHLPLPWTLHSCRCGLPLDSRGHHRAACSTAFVVMQAAGYQPT